MAESLFTDTHLDGASLNENDSQAYTLGTVIDVAVDGVVTHGRWRFPTTLPSGPVAWVLYDFSTETEIGRAVFAAPTAGAWNTAALSPPVVVTAGQRLVACVETPDRYVAKAALFSSAIVSGSLTGPATSTVPNGRFATSHATFPQGSSGGNGYFADLVFDSGSADPAQGAAGVDVALAVDAAGGRVSAGGAVVAAVLDVGAVGGRRSAGAGALGFVLAVSASGAAPARGAAALEVAFGVDARSGRAVVSRPFTGTVMRPNAGVVVRP